MGVHERELDEESSKWVAARLPNPSPPEGSGELKGGITVTDLSRYLFPSVR